MIGLIHTTFTRAPFNWSICLLLFLISYSPSYINFITDMYAWEKHSLYRVWCCPWYQAPTKGLRLYPVPIRAGRGTTIVSEWEKGLGVSSCCCRREKFVCHTIHSRKHGTAHSQTVPLHTGEMDLYWHPDRYWLRSWLQTRGFPQPADNALFLLHTEEYVTTGKHGHWSGHSPNV